MIDKIKVMEDVYVTLNGKPIRDPDWEIIRDPRWKIDGSPAKKKPNLILKFLRSHK